jgi:hypothetical protein
MNEVTLIGIDLGKHSFHLHAQDAAGRMVFRKKLSRQQLLRTLANVPPVVWSWKRVRVRIGWRVSSPAWGMSRD